LSHGVEQIIPQLLQIQIVTPGGAKGDRHLRGIVLAAVETVVNKPGTARADGCGAAT
jgi:hypothetical protein